MPPHKKRTVLLWCSPLGVGRSNIEEVQPTVRDEETLEAIEVVVRVPKPEAQIFTPKMKTKYQSIGYEKSFLKDILDSVKDGPF